MKNKYALYYTLNKNMDFEFTDKMENEMIEKVNSFEKPEIIFHLIFEHFYSLEKTEEKVEKEDEVKLPKWITPSNTANSSEYKINLNDLDTTIKKIIWKFLNLKK